jgi:hypothetical protein
MPPGKCHRFSGIILRMTGPRPPHHTASGSTSANRLSLAIWALLPNRPTTIGKGNGVRSITRSVGPS